MKTKKPTIGQVLYFRILCDMHAQNMTRATLAENMGISEDGLNMALGRMKDKDMVTLKSLKNISDGLGRDLYISFIKKGSKKTNEA